MANEQDPQRLKPRRPHSAYEPPEETPAPKGPKVTPIFATAPAEPSRRAVVRRNVFGRAVETVDAESAEAAAQWRADDWRPLSG